MLLEPFTDTWIYLIVIRWRYESVRHGFNFSQLLAANGGNALRAGIG